MLEQARDGAPAVDPISVPLPRGALKPSRYNVFTQQGDVVWAFNARSTAFARLSAEHHRIAQKFLGGDVSASTPEEKQILDSLIRGQFLVGEELDELGMLKVKNRLTRFNKRGMALIIAPTLRCNFACGYCYVDRNANKMSADTRARVKRFFDENLEEKTGVNIVWTGGDPSLALDVVEELSQHFMETCRTKEAKYLAVLITNGYLLDDEMLRVIKEARIRSVQVTLDGNREAHDQRRCLPNQKPTYDRILDNILRASQQVPIALRINVDRYNYEGVEDIFRDLKARGIGKNVTVFLANISVVNEQSSSYQGRCLTPEEFARIHLRLVRLASEYGLKQSMDDLTGLRGEYCGANSNNYFVIDSNAQLLKCYEDFGKADKHGIGYISEEGKVVIDKHHNLVKWLGWDPFERKECLECKLLPLCMGGCSYSKIRHGEAEGVLGCILLRHSVDDFLKLYGERLSQASAARQKEGCSGECAGS